jgi:hypothetical protein
LGGELVLVSACLTVSPLITGGQAHTHTMSTIYDKPGAGWDKINHDNYFTSYFKTNEMGDVVQQEKNLQHHNNWKRITLL